MKYEGQLFRPPSEHDALILQATIGCSHNKCIYCAMYRDKKFRVRPLDELLAELEVAGERFGPRIQKLFVADGDALIMELDQWLPILATAKRVFPNLRRVSCYAMANNVLAKTQPELLQLRANGLSLFYLGPESGDDATLKRIVKGATAQQHIDAAKQAHDADISISVIAMLGVAGTLRSQEHALATADLVTGMDPEFFSALTTTVVPNTPLERLQEKGGFELPSVEQMLGELRTIVANAAPTNTMFRTNHASNYLPLGGRLPVDRDKIVAVIDGALSGKVPLRPEHTRGL
ncbi:MAG: radical SAM superfamily enzyme YgiQ (UPF0313 family) [Bradymonadia bacterium]|jgi:radical SAM superfamily enzyme YgiQ (UPF0313 family)